MRLEARADNAVGVYRAGWIEGYLSARNGDAERVGHVRTDAWGYGFDAGISAYEYDHEHNCEAT